MGDFTPIQTQEEFDKAIKGRLAQKDRELEERYKDYLSPDKTAELKKAYEEKLEAANKLAKESEAKASEAIKSMSELTKRAEAAEQTVLKNRIANEHKLPMELANRLVGDTEEALNKDAEELSKIVSNSKTAPPYSREVNHTGNADTAKQAAMLNLLSALTDQ